MPLSGRLRDAARPDLPGVHGSILTVWQGCWSSARCWASAPGHRRRRRLRSGATSRPLSPGLRGRDPEHPAGLSRPRLRRVVDRRLPGRRAGAGAVRAPEPTRDRKAVVSRPRRRCESADHYTCGTYGFTMNEVGESHREAAHCPRCMLAVRQGAVGLGGRGTGRAEKPAASSDALDVLPPVGINEIEPDTRLLPCGHMDVAHEPRSLHFSHL
jgi:hypothetical protein